MQKTSYGALISHLVLLALAVFLFISMIFYSPADIPHNAYPANYVVRNPGGMVGAYTADVLFKGFGRGAYLLPLLMLVWFAGAFVEKQAQHLFVKLSATAVLLVSASSFLYLNNPHTPADKFSNGGIAGMYCAHLIGNYFGIAGSYIIILLVFALSIVIATEFLVWPIAAGVVKMATKGLFILFYLLQNAWAKRHTAAPGRVPARSAVKKRPGVRPPSRRAADEEDEDDGGSDLEDLPRAKDAKKGPKISIPQMIQSVVPRPAAPARTVARQPVTEAAKRAEKTLEPAGSSTGQQSAAYEIPSVDLLAEPKPVEQKALEDNLKENSRILEETLLDFGIDAKVTEVQRGPAVTLYELEPAAGVKVNKITALSDDVALSMKAPSVRIVAPIPGKGTVGIEVPNTSTSIVVLKELIASREFQDEKAKLKLALGKDVSGNPVIANLAEMPHLLIAGATGSGKTVCVNTIIMSMLYNATPEEVKFIMIDPKMVELAQFNGLPHLLCPVVTEMKKVPNVLEWVVSEMEGRYRLLAKSGVRNITAYNAKQAQSPAQEPAAGEAPMPRHLPYIVIFIDELADLMMMAADEVEHAITRLAQLSRAVGIHIILATQRPSVDVITGVIKANLPSRISFKVASKVDSRTVLDMNGAEKLLGRGDLLFIEPGASKPIRAQGAYVTDAEIERVLTKIKAQWQVNYNEEILSAQDGQKGSGKRFDRDEVYRQAITLVLQQRQASVSLLQRRLGVGYTRAARLIDMMEEEGIVGPYQGSKPRDILIESMDQLEQTEQQQGENAV